MSKTKCQFEIEKSSKHMMLILIVAFIIVIVYYLKWYIKAVSMDRKTSSLVTIPGLPILGNALIFTGDGEKIFRNMLKLGQLGYKNNDIVKLWLGPKLYVAIGSAVDAQTILDNCMEKDETYRFTRPWLGNGLFAAPVGIWKCHRKLILPVYNNKIVDGYTESIVEKTEILKEKLKKQVDKGTFDVFPFITACTLDIIFEVTIGEQMNVQYNPETPYLRSRKTLMGIMNMRLFKLWLQPEFLFNLTPYAKQQKINIELTRKFTDELVSKRKKEYNIGSLNSIKDVTTTGDKSPPFLDLLFARKVLTDRELRQHVESNTIAGNDTTALVTAYTLVLLGNHHDIQEKVFLEQQLIFGDDKTRKATREDLLRMNYLDRVIKESMRWYTVAPIIARHIDKDLYLPHAQVTIPAGCGAVIGSFAIHKSQAEWGPDVDEFDPDRFLPERSANRHPAAFCSFSYGPRNCIARNLGTLIVKGIVSNVVRNYNIKADPITRFKMEMLLHPTEGHQIELSGR